MVASWSRAYLSTAHEPYITYVYIFNPLIRICYGLRVLELFFSFLLRLLNNNKFNLHSMSTYIIDEILLVELLKSVDVLCNRCDYSRCRCLNVIANEWQFSIIAMCSWLRRMLCDEGVLHRIATVGMCNWLPTVVTVLC